MSYLAENIVKSNDDGNETLDGDVTITKAKYGYQLKNDAVTVLEYSTSKKKWQEARRKFIGGSDAGGVANVIPNSKEKYGVTLWSNYASPLTIYRDKVLGHDKPYTAAMARGHRREAGIRAISPKEIMKKEGLVTGVKVYASKYTYINNTHYFMGANLDGLIDHPIYGVCGLEIKTANEWAGNEWDNEGIPSSYYCQVQHYIYVTGLSRFYLVAEIGDYIHTRIITRNDDFIADLVSAETAFYQQLKAGIEPQPIGIKYESELTKVAQSSNDYTIADDLNDTLAELELLKAQKKELEQAIEAKEILLKMAIGENEGLKVGTKVVSYREQESSRFDSTLFKSEQPELYDQYKKVTTSRVLRIKEVKSKEAS